MTDQTKIKHEKVAPRQNSWSCHAGRVVWIQDKVWLELWMVKVKDDYCDLQPPYFKWRRDTPGNDRIDTRLQIDRYYRYLLPSTFSIYSRGENVELWTLLSWQWIHWIQWWSSVKWSLFWRCVLQASFMNSYYRLKEEPDCACQKKILGFGVNKVFEDWLI